MLEDLYKTRKYGPIIDIEILGRDVTGNNPTERMMFVLYKKLKVLLDDNFECFDKIFKKVKYAPKGYNKTNTASYMFVIYYTTFISAFGYDYEGVLEFIKYIAQGVCKTEVENFTEISLDIIKSLDYRILCR